jgi:hypothetical protein
MPGPGIAPEHVPSVDLERRGLGALRDTGRETALSYSGPTRAKCGTLAGLIASNGVV